MQIAIDGGALCSKSHFGTYTFTQTLLQGLNLYDHKNDYRVYTFCHLNNRFKQHIHLKELYPTTAWMKLRVSWEEWLKPSDIFLALNQSLPLYTKAKIIVFSHGLSFAYYPQFYQSDYIRLQRQFQIYIKHASYIVVSSQKIKQELLSLSHLNEDRVIILPFPIPFGFETTETRERERFFLFLGMNHPIKNIELLIKVFQQFTNQKRYRDYKLYLGGPFEEYASQNIIVKPILTLKEKKRLYQTATAYLAPSLYESFNLPVLEALSQGCPVVGLPSAIIPELKNYVNIAHNDYEFINLLMKSTEGDLKRIDYQIVNSQFSLKKYVYSLIRIYQHL